VTLRAPAGSTPKFKPPLEKVVQASVIDLFRKAGIHVGSTSQYRASRVAEGIPDLLCHAEKIGAFFWFETKSYHPKVPGSWIGFNPYDRLTWSPLPLSPKQIEFRLRAVACGVRHFWGGLPQAEDALVALGFGVRVGELFQYDVRAIR